MENIEDISPKVLTERLRELERLGIIRRRIVSEYLPRNVFKDRKARKPKELLAGQL